MVENLVERIRQKDQRAMSQLYQMYIRELSSVCYRYVPSEADAKDVLQNSFVNIFKSIPTLDYRGEAAFKMWMRKIVVNEALHFLKERKMLKSKLGMRVVETDLEQASEILPFDSEPLEGDWLTPEKLHQLISELPDGCRTVVNLYIFEGYSHRQIAELLNVSERTSASQLYYAKQVLAKRIKQIKKETDNE
jgi:RNA polymerase sigma-70 factor (ECF subfamily)